MGPKTRNWTFKKMPIAVVFVFSFLFLAIVGIIVFFCRRYIFARRTKGTATGAAGAGDQGAGQGGNGQSKAANDIIDWVFSHPQRGLEEWKDFLARSLTQQAAKNESLEDFHLRVEKISNFESAPQLSNLSTSHSPPDEALVVKGEVLWKRFDLSLSVTPGRSSRDILYSVDTRVIVFEFHSLAEAKLTSFDNATVLAVKFPTEPKMRLEVQQNQEANIDIAKLERLVRKTISDAEFRFPLSTQNRSGFLPPGPPERFELQTKAQASPGLHSANQLSDVYLDQKRKLLVKIMKASGLVTSQETDFGSHQPFCVVFLDSPAQRFNTSSVKNTSNPFFDEQFVFDLDQLTKKLTFELHDKDRPENDDFLGMATLTTDDFSRNRHVLPLTGKGPMTFGSLTIEISIVDSSQVPSIMATSHNVQHIMPTASPIVLVSDAEETNNLPSLETPIATQDDPVSRDSRTLPATGSLPPKGDVKKKSLVGKIKQRFRRKKMEPRSQSADRAREKSSESPPPLGEGIYLTPPPSRASANIEYGELPSDAGGRNRSNSLRKGLSRLFHRRGRQEDSPTRLSTRDLDLSREGSTGPPSPLLRSSSSNRRSPQPTSSGLTPTPSEQHLR